ncbi:MAG: arsenate reductase ArsC [Rhodobiaceae bacterium]|jgi:protein-tyrosine-phosphatase
MTSPRNVLFLCTGNSARSILAEAILRHHGAGRYDAFSAGSQPAGGPNPAALATLRARGLAHGFARSKSWNEFAGAGAPRMDLIITVCASAAGEVCPVWPGHPHTAHWGVEDPAVITGSEADILAGFAITFDQMKARIDALLALGDAPLAALMPAIRRIGDLP